MSDDPQMGPGVPNPFGFDLSQLMRMLQSQGPVNIEVARQIASLIATGDGETLQPRPEPPIAPGVATAFEGLVRAAQSAVGDATGIAEALAVPCESVTREEWAHRTLDGLLPVLESLARAFQAGAATPGADDASDAAAEQMFGMLLQTVFPVMMGFWAGDMAGALARHALGQFDLPLPLTGPPTLRFVVPNVDEFADAWALPAEELRYALALRESVHGAQRAVPWVREHLVDLASRYVGAYELRPDALGEQLGALDFTNPMASMEALSNPSELGAVADPAALLDAMRSERQLPLLEELQRFISVLEGYADVVVETVGAQLVPSHARIDEALRRHRLDRGDRAAFVDRLLGLELERHHYEAGVAFCRGVVERAGMAGLNRLWLSPAMAPTAPELEAPGLWLARIELDT